MVFSFLRLAHRSTLLFSLFAFALPNAWGQPTLEPLVTAERGDLPLILSAPHGGKLRIPGVPERRGNVKRETDLGTARVAELLADEIEAKLGKRPYLVIARFHRKYLDANRAPTEAYQSATAKPVYDRYHRNLREGCDELVRRWGRGVLFDIHGQAANPTAIFRGTNNGKTVTHLLNRFGRPAFLGEMSVFGRISANGIAVIPENESRAREDPRYDGGYTVRTYGSGEGGTVDALQLELGRELRRSRSARTTAQKIADAICTFALEYLPIEEPTKAEVDAKLDASRDRK